MAANGRVTVLIGSPLEPKQIERISAVDPTRVSVFYEAELLPIPRYEGDHHGVPRSLNQEQLARWQALLADTEVMFDFDWLDTSTLPQRAPRLRWLQATSAGIGELIARSGLANSGIRFTTAAGVHASALAEFTLMGLLYWTKNVPFLQRRQAERHWQRYTSSSLAGKRALIVGLGEVGREIARTCAALRMEVWGMRRSLDDSPPEGVHKLIRKTELRDALPRLDALILACPLTTQTYHLIGKQELASLPRHAIVVNVARGAVIDEAALIDLLRRGGIRGAVLDAFEHEPLPPENPLWSLPNVLVSPHSASTVPAENERIVDIFIDNLQRYLDNQPLKNEFDAERGY